MLAITCPLKTVHRWAEMRRDRSGLFDAACELENLLNRRRRRLGRDPVWLTRRNRPLSEAISQAQDMLPGFDAWATDGLCDNNSSCFT